MTVDAVQRRDRGEAAERAACEHLQRAGLTLLARNARFRGGELDLVMRDGASVVFVEVRYRQSPAFGGGAASVDARKQRKLLLAAQMFLGNTPALAQQPCRFDVIEASGPADDPALRWIKDAFRADGS
ncbi:YraN family protein [Pseudoxanthomonas dokdonensis]|uniref:UPF0102 protein ABB29_09460 n=1 Tax=Pseudoxanthomonas dokdonensis TaxID=344882 RepID=A0A0R0CVJ0_9GAMM|nr:YraN family protein [Pseudoxanthomonas dokdonensis]KRG69684.1 hypothetical protein ABB29_09460 [Pseudoxanthomonas dokdonensis]